MSRFITNLEVKITDKVSTLVTPLVYESDLLGFTIVVPVGFQTDFASVPRVPVAYWFWGGRSHRESVIHDYLYRIDSIPVVSRFFADRVFLEAMEVRQKSASVRWPMFWGVRIGGLSAYHKKKVEDPINH